MERVERLGMMSKRDLIREAFTNMVDMAQRRANNRNLPLNKELFVELIYGYFNNQVIQELGKEVESFILDSKCSRYETILDIKEVYEFDSSILSNSCKEVTIPNMFILEMNEKCPTEAAQKTAWNEALVEFQEDMNMTLDYTISKVRLASTSTRVMEYNTFKINDDCAIYIPSKIKFVLIKNDDNEF